MSILTELVRLPIVLWSILAWSFTPLMAGVLDIADLEFIHEMNVSSARTGLPGWRRGAGVPDRGSSNLKPGTGATYEP
jgi:hypothetical protein